MRGVFASIERDATCTFTRQALAQIAEFFLRKTVAKYWFSGT